MAEENPMIDVTFDEGRVQDPGGRQLRVGVGDAVAVLVCADGSHLVVVARELDGAELLRIRRLIPSEPVLAPRDVEDLLADRDFQHARVERLEKRAKRFEREVRRLELELEDTQGRLSVAVQFIPHLDRKQYQAVADTVCANCQGVGKLIRNQMDTHMSRCTRCDGTGRKKTPAA